MRARGIASVEFALVMLVLVPLVLGAVEFGRVVAAWDTLARSTRAAARHLAVGSPSDPARQLEARCIVVTGSPATSAGDCAQPAQLPGLTVQQVRVLEPSASATVRLVATGAGTLDLVTVTVSGWRFPALGWSVLPAFNFTPVSVTVAHAFY